jgi:hypothetical protein
VPTVGHQGTVGGERKYVRLFSRTTAAGQPTLSDPRKRGWKLLKALRTDRAGGYHSGLLQPSGQRRLPAAATVRGGYTSVVKAAVR